MLPHVMLSALLLATAATAPAAAPAGEKVDAPPGMVLIKGGSTKIGSTEKEILAIGEQDELLFMPTVCETPQHEVKVDDFFLMVNEVTNEQYHAFVKATGWRVPEHWAEQVIDQHQREYLADLEKRIKEAKDKGEPPPERVAFQRSDWWRRNADDHKQEGTDWVLPKGKETTPVVFVNYQDAQAYARWAGVRLMTEFEYQRAGRGNSARRYPWGDAFDPANALTTSTRTDRPKVVGSMPGGATSDGVFELCGNVWEWTDSPFMPYPRWKVLKLEIGKKPTRQIDGLVAWDENNRVAVSGSFQNGEIAARLTTRRPTDRYQSTDSLGFRCAASVLPGLDISATVMRQDVPPEVRPVDVQYDTSKVVAIDRWHAGSGTAKLEGYAVIEGYDYVLYVPVVEMDASSVKQLGELTAETGPAALGVLSLTCDVAEPALPAGTYFVSYLAKGLPKDKKGTASSGIALRQDPAAQDPAGDEVVVEYELPEGIDRAQDNLVFYSPDDRPVAAVPLNSIEFTRPKEPQILIGEATRTVMQPNKRDELEPVQIPCDQVILNVNTWSRVSNKGFNYNVVLKLEKGALGEGWRR